MDLRSLIAFLETFVTFLGYAILFKSITKYRLAVWEWLVSVLVLPILASGFAVVMLLCFADMDGFKTVMIKNIVVLLWFTTLSYRHDRSLLPGYHIFYGLFPVAVEDILLRTVSYSLAALFSTRINAIGQSWIAHVDIWIPVPIYFMASKLLEIDISNVKKTLQNYLSSTSLILINLLMAFYFFGIDYVALKSPFGSVGSESFRERVTFVYIILLFLFLFYLNYKYVREQEIELQRQQELELISLENYSKHVESLYQEVRSFRHDYANILLSIGESIDRNDLETIKKIYNDITNDSEKFVKNSKFDLTRLSHISNSAIKSLMTAKFLEAENLGITITLEVPEVVECPKILLITYIRILAILLDNAIEAAVLSDVPKISVANFYQDDNFVFMIENSTKEDSIPIDNIYQKGYSSKGDNRGIGLATVSEFQQEYDNLSIETSSSNHLFRQILRIYES